VGRTRATICSAVSVGGGAVDDDEVAAASLVGAVPGTSSASASGSEIGLCRSGSGVWGERDLMAMMGAIASALLARSCCSDSVGGAGC
jgi:hypothetical protein